MLSESQFSLYSMSADVRPLQERLVSSAIIEGLVFCGQLQLLNGLCMRKPDWFSSITLFFTTRISCLAGHFRERKNVIGPTNN